MDIKQILKDEGFVFSKRYGQNFITDTNLLHAIALDAELEKGDVCVEVGTGAGTLTAQLCDAAGKVVSFEVDERLSGVLRRTLAGKDNLRLVFADILKDGEKVLKSEVQGPYKVVANLPYYITTPIIFFFLADENCRSITVMVQKEVAERLVSEAGKSEYGAVSAQVALLGNVKITRIVPRTLFYPVPSVDSAVIRIDINPKVDDKQKRDKVSRLIAAAFSMRRKTLANNLSSAFGISREQAIAAITACGFQESIRGEKLSVFDFIRLEEKLSDFF